MRSRLIDFSPLMPPRLILPELRAVMLHLFALLLFRAGLTECNLRLPTSTVLRPAPVSSALMGR
eukprot:1759756-Pyramimonas_sp.AAC.1